MPSLNVGVVDTAMAANSSETTLSAMALSRLRQLVVDSVDFHFFPLSK